MVLVRKGQYNVSWDAHVGCSAINDELESEQAIDCYWDEKSPIANF